MGGERFRWNDEAQTHSSPITPSLDRDLIVDRARGDRADRGDAPRPILARARRSPRTISPNRLPKHGPLTSAGTAATIRDRPRYVCSRVAESSSLGSGGEHESELFHAQRGPLPDRRLAIRPSASSSMPSRTALLCAPTSVARPITEPPIPASNQERSVPRSDRR